MTWQIATVIIVAILAGCGVWALWMHRTSPRDNISEEALKRAGEAMQEVAMVRKELHGLATAMGFKRTTAPLPPLQQPVPFHTDSER